MVAPDGHPRLLAAIRERRSLRAFAATPLSEADLAVLFEAARWAPSSGNGQPWRFVITRRGSGPFDTLAATLSAGNRWATRAPVLLLAAARSERQRRDEPPKRNRNALLELGLALGNLLTQATAVGVVCHPMAGFDPVAAGEAMAVPEGHEVAVLVAIGYPGDAAHLDPEVRAKDQRPRERRSLDEFVFEGRWGMAARLGSQSVADSEGGEP